MAVVDELTDVRRADGLALRLRAGDDDQLDARLGQNRRERLVIQARRVGERLFADVAPRQIQRGRNAGEERRIQLGMGAGDNVRILEEIGGERRGGDHVAAGGDDRNVAVFRAGGLDHRHAIRIRHERAILAEHEQHDALVFLRRARHQRLVPEGEGVRVHHQRRAGALARIGRKAFQVARKAVAPVFHEHEAAVHARDFRKAQRRKELRAVHLRV